MKLNITKLITISVLVGIIVFLASSTKAISFQVNCESVICTFQQRLDNANNSTDGYGAAIT